MFRLATLDPGLSNAGKAALLVFGLSAMFACRASTEVADYTLLGSTASTWVDRSVNAEQDAINACDWSNEGRTVQCVFVERATLKAWSAGVAIKGAELYPELKTWQQASDHCQSLKGYGRIGAWRLPTIDEAQGALLGPAGTYRKDSLIDLIDSVPAMGLWPKYGLIWTDTADPNDRRAHFAVLRGPASAPAAPSSVDRPKHWLCVADVSADALRGDPLAFQKAKATAVPSSGSAPASRSAKPTPSASKSLAAKLPPETGCPSDYPGKSSGQFRVSSAFKDKVQTRLDQHVQKTSLGSYGQLVLSADTGFPFEDLSSAIDAATRDRLRTVLGLYVDAVTEAVGPGHEIAFAVVGHASPTFNGVYLSPQQCDGKGPQGNKSFAFDRAKTVADALISLQAGLSGKVDVMSAGHLHPVPTTSPVARVRCGPYDCEASKRVEIFFSARSSASAE